MKVLQSPVKTIEPKKAVFLAGGITGCHDWQADLISELYNIQDSNLIDLSNLAVFNPRREDFDTTDKTAAIEQIKWEHKRLKFCDFISFFFPSSESVQPITLFELGKHYSTKPHVISIVKGYKREVDVTTQLALDGYICNVYDDYKEAIQNHAREIAILYDNLRKGQL